MKSFWKFTLCLSIIGYVLCGIAMAATEDLDIFCVLMIFVLPALVVIAVISAIVIGVMALVGRRRRRAQLTRQHDRAQVTVDVTLTDYLTKAKDRGITYAQVNQRCRTNGWSDAEIQEARRLLSGEGV